MADINIKRAHGRSLEEARQIAQMLMDKLEAQFDVKHRWDGDVLRFQRSGVEGQVAVTPTDLQITAKLGLLLKALRGRIESEVNSVLDRKLG